MFHVDDILFGVSLALGICLVLSSALGLDDVFGETDTLSSVDAVDVAETEVSADGASVLSVLGLGRVPLLILWMQLSLLFGGTGLVLSPLLHALLGDTLGAGASVGLSAIVSLLGTRLLSRCLARVLPSSESYASRKVDLVGSEGTVLVASRRGDAVLRVIDAGGAELRVRCESGARTLSVGDRVCMVAYDAARDRFEVEKVSVG